MNNTSVSQYGLILMRKKQKKSNYQVRYIKKKIIKHVL